MSTVSQAPVLKAPGEWQTVEFLSDLHLHAGDQATCDAWQRYLAASPADAIIILGDLFEVWVGDDAAVPDTFEAQCEQVLLDASRQRPVFFMHGNRDFLLGADALTRCGLQVLDDPTVLDFGAQRWLLSHGDALCLDDTDYMRFRAEVRAAPWQQAFLARPLAERQALARQIREGSEARKRSAGPYIDLDLRATRQWLLHNGCHTLIHGHTHLPAHHDLGDGLAREVLSDWDLQAQPPRAEVLRLHRNGQCSRHRLTAAGVPA